MKRVYFLSTVLFMFGFITKAWSANTQAQQFQSYMVPAQHNEQFKEKLSENADKYQEALGDLQLVMLVDRSYSMLNKDNYAFQHLNQAPASKFFDSDAPQDFGWKRMDSAFMLASHLASTMLKYDKDGKIPVYFFGKKVDKVDIHNAEELYMQFGNYPPARGQTTNLHGALDIAFSQNIKKKHAFGKPDRTLFLVITDGKPDGKEDRIAHLIDHQVSSVDKKGDRLNVFFIQIGDDKGASEFLDYMDTQCKHIKNNVDTKKDDYVYARLAEQVIKEAIFEDQE